MASTFGKLPLSFEANHGQTARDVRFLSRGPGYSLFLTSTEAVLRSSHAALRLRLAGADPSVRLSGVDELPGRSNYFLGSDPAQWRTAVPHFARVKYERVYPGVDLVFYGNPQQLEYDFIVAPGADPSAIRLDVRGAKKLALDASGDLVLTTSDGEVRLHQPMIYQEHDGVRQPVSGGFVRQGKHGVTFQVAEYDRTRPLVIDPSIGFAAYLGGSGNDGFSDLAVDSSGNIYITGNTDSPNFPTSSGALKTALAGGRDVFLTKLSSDGKTVLYSTFLGGSADDFGGAIALASDGSIYLAGSTSSTNFPTVTPSQAALGGGQDAFLARLKPDGSALLFSTYFGGNDTEFVSGMALDPSGNAYLLGGTHSFNFPAKSPFQTPALPQFGNIGYIAKFSATGGVTYASLFGDGSMNMGGIAVDSAGNAYVCGQTFSRSFPTTPGAYKTTAPSSAAGFVSKINPAGSGLVWSTYLGGSTNANDFARAIAVDASGNVYVAGTTQSSDFPTLNPIQAKLSGPSDAFLTIFKPDGSGLQASTYYGGSGNEAAYDLSLAGTGTAVVVAGPFSGTLNGASGTAPGGSSDVGLFQINDFISPTAGAVTVVMAGISNSADLPVKNPIPFTPATCGSNPCNNFFVASFIISGLSAANPGDLIAQAVRGTAAAITMTPGNALANGGQGSSGSPDKVKTPPATAVSCTYKINPTVQTYPWFPARPNPLSGYLATVYTQPGCPWTASTNADWISFLPGTFPTQGTGRIYYGFSANTANMGRSDTINVQGMNQTLSLLVGQERADCSFKLGSAAPQKFGPNGGTGSVHISTTPKDCQWTAWAMYYDQDPNPGWITVSPSSGTGDADITYTIAPLSPSAFPQGKERVGFIDTTAGYGSGVIEQIPPPAISGISPATAQPGTAVTASGSFSTTTPGLAPLARNSTASAALDVVVRFNGAVGAVLSNNGTQLVAVVPSNATTGPITVTTAGGTATSPTNLTVTSNTPPANLPVINTGGVVNAANFTTQLAPGSLASAFGTRIATSMEAAATVPLPTTLGGGTFQFDDPIAVPTIFASPAQTNFQIPWELSPGDSYLTVLVGGLPADPVKVTLTAAAPGIFTTTQTGKGQGAVQIANTVIFAAPAGSIQGVQTQPAKKGTDFLTVYCTGLGDVTNRPASGAAAPSDPLAATVVTPTVTIGGVPATVSFSGLTPGFVGLYQVNVQVPAGAPTGDAVPLIINVGGVASNMVTIAVQ